MRRDVSVGELAEWIDKNRSGDAFKDYSFTQIIGEIYFGIENGSLVVENDQNGEIVGVCYGKLEPEKKEYFIWNIIMKRPWVMKRFIEIFHDKWPSYTLLSNRHGKKNVVTYTDKIYKRLIKA